MDEPSTHSENEHFGLSVGKSLDKLLPHVQARAKMRIHQVLYEEEFGLGNSGGIVQIDNGNNTNQGW
jgi:hypothetical protein